MSDDPGIEPGAFPGDDEEGAPAEPKADNFAPLIYVDLEYTPKPEDHTGGRWQPYTILIKSGDNNAPLFKSTEAYTNEADAKHAIDLAFGPGSNVYLRQREQGNQVIRMANSELT